MSKRCDYIIADRRVRLSGAVAEMVERALGSFKPFVAACEADAEPLLEIKSSENLDFDKETYTLLTQFELEDGLGQCCFYGADFGYALVIEGGEERFLMLCDKGVKVVEVLVESEPASKYISYLRFGLWFAINMAFVQDGCSAVHSSTIVWDGEAVMFLGESGTGKSTHTRLWLDNISGAELLNDDSPFVACDDEGVKVYGSPWSGKTPCYKNECYPLRAMVRLSQAPHNAIKQLRGVRAIGALLPSLPPAFVFDKTLENALLGVLSKVLGKVKVYHLECLPDIAAAELSFITVFDDEVTG